MALTERQRARLRTALDDVLRAERALAGVADELAHAGHTEADRELDAAADLIGRLVAVLEPLAGGRG